MKRNILTIIFLSLIAFALTMNIVGCKKDEAPSPEGDPTLEEVTGDAPAEAPAEEGAAEEGAAAEEKTE